MRRVKVLRYDAHEQKLISSHLAWFHAWSIDHVEYESGPGPFPAAILEHDDGTVAIIAANYIQFITPPHGEGSDEPKRDQRVSTAHC